MSFLVLTIMSCKAPEEPKEKTFAEKRVENTSNAVSHATHKRLYIPGKYETACVEFSGQNQFCKVTEVNNRTGKAVHAEGLCELSSNSAKTYVALICRKVSGAPCVGSIDIISNESISSGQLHFSDISLGSEILVRQQPCSDILKDLIKE